MGNTSTIKKPRISRKAGTIVSIVCAVGIAVLVLISVLLIAQNIADGVSMAKIGFDEAYTLSRQTTEESVREKAKAFVDEHYHVSNRVDISVKNVCAANELEVLKVNGVAYIIDEKDNGTTSWLQAQGSGTFTVDLAKAEFIVDNTHSYVLVRVPKPALESKDISVDYWMPLLFKENKWSIHNSIASGEELARNQLIEAQNELENDFRKNEEYFEMAELMAESMLRALIRSANADVPELQVGIEFY